MRFWRKRTTKGIRIVFGVRKAQEKEAEIVLLEAGGLWMERNLDENARKLVDIFTEKALK